MRNFKAIFFDLDDTLCDWQEARSWGIEAAHTAIAKAHPELALSDFKATFDAVSTEMFAEWSKFTRPSAELRLERSRRTLTRLGLNGKETLADEATEIFFDQAIANLKLFDDVETTLDALRSQYILGLITNTLADVQWVKIRKLNLEKYLPHIFIASEVGVSKPDPVIFQRALNAAHVKAEEFLFVGNSLEDDIAGARAAQVASVWLNRHGASAPETLQPDFMIRSLRELLQIVTSTEGCIKP
jgi:putative hydrolase of the HAD superfamily